MKEQYKLNEWNKLPIDIKALDKICDSVLGFWEANRNIHLQS